MICWCFYLCVFSWPDLNSPETENKVIMSPEQGVFGYGSVELLAGEEDETFDP